MASPQYGSSCGDSDNVSVQTLCHIIRKCSLSLWYEFFYGNSAACYLQMFCYKYCKRMAFLQCECSCVFSGPLQLQMIYHINCTCVVFLQCEFSCVFSGPLLL